MHTVKLTLADFKEKIFDFEKEQEWKYKGPVPAIIDFYADWCRPCKMVVPVLGELAKENNHFPPKKGYCGFRIIC